MSFLTSESVEGTSLPLEGIDDIHSGDSLPLGVFGVGDGITDNVLKEDLKDTTGLLVDQARDTLDTTTTRQTADSGLGDSLDVITQDFAMTLGASLAESFSSFTTSSHVVSYKLTDAEEKVAPAFYTKRRGRALGSRCHVTNGGRRLERHLVERNGITLHLAQIKDVDNRIERGVDCSLKSFRVFNTSLYILNLF